LLRCKARRAEQRLPHALLLTGVPGIGKRHFAQFLAQGLLCEAFSASRYAATDAVATDDIAPCGVCASCQQILADAHPDYRHVLPEGASSTIKIDAVRHLIQWLQLTASGSGLKAAVVESADTMNWHAANSLLKTLEEPSAGTLLLLTADRVAALPATIRSRCQTVTLKLSASDPAIAWLEQHGIQDARSLIHSGPSVGPFELIQQHAPERQAERQALEAAWLDLLLQRGSVGRIASSLADYAATECLATFAHMTAAVIKYRQSGAGLISASTGPSSMEIETFIEPVADQLESEQWFALYDRILQLHRSDSASIKTKGVLEGLFADIRIMTNG